MGYGWTETKSKGRDFSFTYERNSFTHTGRNESLSRSVLLSVICFDVYSFSPLNRSSGTKLLVAGPPMRSLSETDLTALAFA